MSGVPVERFRRAREDPSLAVLEGFHAVKHAIRFGAQITQLVSPDPDEVRRLARDLAPDVIELLGAAEKISTDRFAELSPTPPATPLIAIARRPATEAGGVLSAPDPAPVVLLERPRHLGNIGAAVRVAAAAGAAGVLTTGEADPWHPAALRGAAGLHFALPVIRLPDAPETDRPLVAVHPEGDPLEPAAIPERALLAFGTERGGLGPDLLGRAERRLRIPMRAGVSSLNLATAASIVLYTWRLGPSGRAFRSATT